MALTIVKTIYHNPVAVTSPAFYQASNTPFEDIAAVSYPGQDPSRRQYRPGYERFLNAMPILFDDDAALLGKVAVAKLTMQDMAAALKQDPWSSEDMPGPGGFTRTILAIQHPDIECLGYANAHVVKKEGAELLVAKWGDGHTSPVHGHTNGLLHEEILNGMMRVNTYRIIDENSRLARPLSTVIATSGTFASSYTKADPRYNNKRRNLVHNFTSVGPSATLHFVSEHTRDGRDNGFEVEYFEEAFGLGDNDVAPITAKDGLYLRKGEVVLVRSTNVPEYGDHFIVITGAPEMKEHGLRPKDVAIGAPKAAAFLDKYNESLDNTGVTLLKLSAHARDYFLSWHGIVMKDGEVIFPEA